MLSPTLITRDMSPAEVLAAMLPVVREVFGDGHWSVMLDGALRPDDERITYSERDSAVIYFASHVLPAMVAVFAWPQPPGSVVPITAPTHETLMNDLADRVTAFRDAWCDAVERTRETT